MSSRNFKFSQAAADLITVLPDASAPSPVVGQSLLAFSVVPGQVTTKFASVSGSNVGAGLYLPLSGGTLTGPLTIAPPTGAGFPASVSAGVLTVGAADGSQPIVGIVGFGGPGVNIGKPIFQLYRAGGTRAAPTAVPINTNLGAINVFGYGATTFGNVAAAINFTAVETFTDTAHGTAIAFNTTPTGSVTGAEAMRVSASGNLLIGTVTDAVYLFDALSTAKSSRVSVIPGTTAFVLHGNTIAPPAILANTALQIVGAATGIVRQEMVAFAGQSYITLRRSEGTASAPAATGNAVGFGGIQAAGHTGAAWNTGSNAAITFITGGLWSPTSTPTIIAFTTTAIGVATGAEAMRIAPSGNLLIGTTTDGAYKLDVVGGVSRFDTGTGGAFPVGGPTAGVIISAPDGTPVQAALNGFGTSGSTPSIQLWRATGTRAAPAALAGATSMGSINGFGYGATGYCTSARTSINFVASENWSDTAQGSSIFFSATPLGSTTTSSLMRLWGSGNLIIGGTQIDAGYKLDVTGNTRLNGTIGFQGTNPIAKPTVSGAKGSNAALASLLTALASYGLITDTTGA